MRLLLVRSRKQENVTLTTMPVIWTGAKTIFPFPFVGWRMDGGADITSRLCFASLIILYRIRDINHIKTTNTLSKISSFVTTPSAPPPLHTHKRRIAGTTPFHHHSPGTC